ncbi:MAG TPA: hypothetical protein VGN86_09680, partial [Pyrinomonadaceae bacterium]|nr:hypothetical protein [Pyrinomonadaceae bacterium]
TTNGNANFASISPDGKYVGYVKSEGGKQSLWLRQVGSAGNLEIIPPREGYYQGLAFSPDGNYIYYGYTTDPAVSEVFKVPTLSVGAIGVKVKPTEGPSNMSHDGKHNALVRFDREHQQDLLIVTNADGSNEQVMTTRKWPARLAWDWGTTTAWSSDDKKLVLPVMNSDAQGVYVTMLEVNVADHSERIIPMSPQRFEQPSDITVLKDTRGIILSGKAQGASFSQIWYLGLDGSARPLTNDLSDYLAAVLTEDSTSLVTVQRQTLGNIWTSTKNDSAKPIQVTSGLGRYFDITWSPDNKIVYASDASGIADIYEVNADGSGVKQLTSGMKRNYSPTVSPDNRYIAFHSNRSGIFQIWRMDRDGSSQVQLTTGDTESNWPQFSPDGKYIYYEHFEAGRTGTTWRVGVENGTPERVNDGYTLRPTISPDGKWLAYWYNEGQETSRWRLQITSLDGSQQVRTFDLAKSVAVQWDTMLHWSSDSRSLTFVDRRGGVDNIWAQPIDGGPTRQVTKFSDSQIFAFDWYKDGTLAASRGVITSDVVLISEVTTR